VTRRFGLKYLWIDVLCIMQDSENDIVAERSTMSTIYANSACNLAATCSPFDGPFRKRTFEGAMVGDMRPVWSNLGGKYEPLKQIHSYLSHNYFG
jgi:Heterokaryon incompatibility protein (HET)